MWVLMARDFTDSPEFDAIFKGVYERRVESNPDEGYESRSAYVAGYIDAWNDALESLRAVTPSGRRRTP